MNVLSSGMKEKPIELKETPHQSDFLPRQIKRRHIENVIIVFGSGDRPTAGGDVQAHFDTTSFVFSCWSGSAWKTTTLS